MKKKVDLSEMKIKSIKSFVTSPKVSGGLPLDPGCGSQPWACAYYTQGGCSTFDCK